MTDVHFITKDGEGQFVIPLACLMEYPESLMARQVTTGVGNEGGFYVVLFGAKVLEHVAHFYVSGAWKNPHLLENKMPPIDDVEEGFDAICNYLGLPTEPIEEVDEHVEEVDYSSDGEKDFYPEAGREFEDDDPYPDDDEDDFVVGEGFYDKYI